VGVFCLVVNGIGTDEFRWILSGKGAYDTFIMVREIQTKFKTPEDWFTLCYKVWITYGKLFLW